MEKRVFTVAIVAAIMFVASCQTTDTRDESSIDFRIKPGSRLILNEKLVLPSDRRRVYLQFGRVMKKREDDYSTGCYFRVLNEDTTVIQPDTFTITKVTDSREDVLQGDIADYIMEFKLESPTQPQVLKMSCHKWDATSLGRPPTFVQIKRAVGLYVTFELRI
jgi:hypothetical protein